MRDPSLGHQQGLPIVDYDSIVDIEQLQAVFEKLRKTHSWLNIWVAGVYEERVLVVIETSRSMVRPGGTARLALSGPLFSGSLGLAIIKSEG